MAAVARRTTTAVCADTAAVVGVPEGVVAVTEKRSVAPASVAATV